MEYLKTLIKSITWLAAYISGVLAVLYGAGFLIVRSHLHMLGLDYVFDVQNSKYLEEGGKFFYNTFIILINYLIGIVQELALLILILIVASGLVGGVLLLFVFTAICRLKYAKLKTLVTNGWARIHKTLQKISELYKLKVWYVRGILAVLIYATFIGTLSLKDVSFFAPLKVSGILQYSESTSGKNPGHQLLEKRITESIRAGKDEFCKAYYASLLVILIVFGLILAFIKKYFIVGFFTRLCCMPLFMVFIICASIIPLSYGVLIAPNTYPIVLVSVQKNANSKIPEGLLFLVNRDERELVLWDYRLKRTYILFNKDLLNLQIIGQSSIFKDPSSDNSP